MALSETDAFNGYFIGNMINHWIILDFRVAIHSHFPLPALAFITRLVALLSPQPPSPTSVKRRQSQRANLGDGLSLVTICGS